MCEISTKRYAPTLFAILPSFAKSNVITQWGSGFANLNNQSVLDRNVLVSVANYGVEWKPYVDIPNTQYGGMIRRNTFYNCGASAFKNRGKYAGLPGWYIFNNLIVTTPGYGFDLESDLGGESSTQAQVDRCLFFFDYNAFYGCDLGNYNLISAGAHDIQLTADPFVDAAGGDFRLNSAAGGGAVLRGTGYPVSWPEAA